MYSVVIPVYEAAAQVGRCVDSWLSQTEKDLELILVDDGSADGSGKICDQYAEKDPRVHVIHQKNAGVSAARNAGMDAAEGEYLLFTDSDDYVAEDYLEKMASCQRESAADLVLCGFHHLYDGADIRKIPKPAGTFRVSEEPEDFLRLYEQGFFNMPWNKLYKRELAGRFDISISLGEDLLFNLDYLRKCRTVCVLAEPLCYYIQEEQKTTLSSRKRQDRLSLAKRICEETERFYEQICREENAERRSMGHRRIFTRYMNEIMDECEKMPTEKSLTRREKMQVIRFCAEDRWVRERGCEAIFLYPDYRILWFFLHRRQAGMVYLLCVLRSAVVRAVHFMRRKKGGTIWNL